MNTTRYLAVCVDLPKAVNQELMQPTDYREFSEWYGYRAVMEKVLEGEYEIARIKIESYLNGYWAYNIYTGIMKKIANYVEEKLRSILGDTGARKGIGGVMVGGNRVIENFISNVTFHFYSNFSGWRRLHEIERSMEELLDRLKDVKGSKQHGISEAQASEIVVFLTKLATRELEEVKTLQKDNKLLSENWLEYMKQHRGKL